MGPRLFTGALTGQRDNNKIVVILLIYLTPERFHLYTEVDLQVKKLESSLHFMSGQFPVISFCATPSSRT